MHHRPAGGDKRIDRALDRRTVRSIVAVEDRLPFGRRKAARDAREQLPVADGTVQVDQQPRGGGRMQRRIEAGRDAAREFECARVPAAVGREQRVRTFEQVLERGRHPVAAMLAADHQHRGRGRGGGNVGGGHAGGAGFEGGTHRAR
jgi:hypothetical protein